MGLGGSAAEEDEEEVEEGVPYCISPTPCGNPVSTKMLPEYRPAFPTASKVVCATTVSTLAGDDDDGI